MKILVADDHKTIVQGLILDLKDLVGDVPEIAGASKSSEIISLCEERWDIIFMDIDMPAANGIDLAKDVLKKHPRTNIVYITGYDKYAFESYQTNASTFLLKPITKKALKKALESLRFPIPNINDDFIKEESTGSAIIGSQIKKFREERGMTRNELAEELHVTPPTIHRWESGVRTPDVINFINIANVLGVSLDEFTGS